MTLNYKIRFGNLPPEQALHRVIRAMGHEAQAARFVYCGTDNDASPSWDDVDPADSNPWARIEAQRALSLLIQRRLPPIAPNVVNFAIDFLVPYSRLRTSSAREIGEALDAIAEKTGEDYSWLKELIGKSPETYLALEGRGYKEYPNLPPDRRDLLSRLLE